MPRTSAGILLYRRRERGLEVLLAHPGGPMWRNRDEGAWTIPKGEVGEGENLLAAVRREFAEEIGFVPEGEFVELTPVRQKGGKIVHAWAVEGDCDLARIQSNTCRLQWPPKSDRWITIPEVDRAAFFDLDTARKKINPAQAALLEELPVKAG